MLAFNDIAEKIYLTTKITQQEQQQQQQQNAGTLPLLEHVSPFAYITTILPIATTQTADAHGCSQENLSFGPLVNEIRLLVCGWVVMFGYTSSTDTPP
jgi:hypothetical protein